MVESASRSLEKPTPQKIEQFVKELIDQRVADGQLDESDLTLAELRIITERFRFTLMTMLHTRIAYPKQDTKTGSSRDENLRPDVMASTKRPASAPPVSAA
jgi:membrane-associated HD superfamily phosphohydrolase